MLIPLFTLETYLICRQVFYSSSAQIGRLIENLSQNMEAGTFNFSLPSTQAARSNLSSYHSSDTGGHWTVEDALDDMLGSIARSS
jgi:serine/arginine repetitive matrix protein 2